MAESRQATAPDTRSLHPDEPRVRDRRPTSSRVRPRPDAVAWPSYGFASGVIGAAVVALLLLLVDLAAGRPLWTPAALGSALFTGQQLAAEGFEPWNHMALVVGYTAIHGAVFVGFGACGAFLLMTAQRLPRSIAVLGLASAAVLFVLFELTFLLQAALFDPGLTGSLGAGWVATANAAAALAMGSFLARFAGPRAPRASEDLPKP